MDQYIEKKACAIIKHLQEAYLLLQMTYKMKKTATAMTDKISGSLENIVIINFDS